MRINRTRELIKSSAVIQNQSPAIYKIDDLTGELVKGTFNAQELQHAEKDQNFDIESILDQRRHKIGNIEWKWSSPLERYPSKFDNWIFRLDLI